MYLPFIHGWLSPLDKFQIQIFAQSIQYVIRYPALTIAEFTQSAFVNYNVLVNAISALTHSWSVSSPEVCLPILRLRRSWSM